MEQNKEQLNDFYNDCQKTGSLPTLTSQEKEKHWADKIKDIASKLPFPKINNNPTEYDSRAILLQENTELKKRLGVLKAFENSAKLVIERQEVYVEDRKVQEIQQVLKSYGIKIKQAEFN